MSEIRKFNKENDNAVYHICGKTLEANIKEFQKVKKEFDEIIDFQQHTYSHVLLKTVVMEAEKGIEVYKGGSLTQIEEEVRITNQLLKKHLGVDCIASLFFQLPFFSLT